LEKRLSVFFVDDVLELVCVATTHER
jgi:hypothetical protein